MDDRPHVPVLQNEIVQFFSSSTLKIFVDATLGAGGHALSILQSHPEIELFIGIDQDVEGLKIAKKNLTPFASKIKYVHGNFREIDTFLKEMQIPCIDGILFDLGVSSMQLNQKERGFSFSKDAPLDMRMNQHNTLTARDVVNSFSEQEIGNIIRIYGEEKRWKHIARAIVKAREEREISSTKDLVDILTPLLKCKGKPHLHPATLVFQALRIFVNEEMQSIEQGVSKAIDLLCPKGKIAVISFHSLEDRIIKNLFRSAQKDREVRGLMEKKITPKLQIVTKKPLVATKEEVQANPRARSAKLRQGVRI